MTTKKQSVITALQERFVYYIDTFEELWKMVGLDQNTINNRFESIQNHIINELKDILIEEEESKQNLITRIETLLKEASEINKELKTEITDKKYEEMPLYAVETDLKAMIQEKKLILDEKKKEIKKLIHQEAILCRDMGLAPNPIAISPLPSETDVYNYKERIEELANQKFILEELVSTQRNVVREIMQELKIEPCLDFERQIYEGRDEEFSVTPENMNKLKELHDSLKVQLNETKALVMELRQQLSLLWERLEENPAVRSAFLEKYPGYSLDTLEALKKEITRCESKIRANIKIYVEKLRTELVEWWDKCKVGEDQRKRFKEFNLNCFTEDLLTLHEMKVDKLRHFYEENKQIFEMLVKREELWSKMLELEECSKKPDRYKNRGGQLLKEEKERRALAKKLPEIEAVLQEQIDEYEKTNNVPFLVFGEPISEIIKRSWAGFRQDKHVKLSARKQARDQTITPRKTGLSTCASQVLTPAANTTKRKFNTPLYQSAKRSRVLTESNANALKVPRSMPVKVNGSIIKRRNSGARRKLDTSRNKKRRVSAHKARKIAQASSTTSTTISEYNEFAAGLGEMCRSTVFANGVPVTPKRHKENVPHLTPASLKTCSPSSRTFKSRLTPATNLPIIF